MEELKNLIELGIDNMQAGIIALINNLRAVVQGDLEPDNEVENQDNHEMFEQMDQDNIMMEFEQQHIEEDLEQQNQGEEEAPVQDDQRTWHRCNEERLHSAPVGEHCDL